MTWHTRLGADRTPPFTRRTERLVALAVLSALAVVLGVVLFGG